MDHLVDDTAYSRQKCSLEKEFTYFLREYRGGKGLVDANPEDIPFLVLKDKKVKTQVHDISCQFLGKKRVHLHVADLTDLQQAQQSQFWEN